MPFAPLPGGFLFSVDSAAVERDRQALAAALGLLEARFSKTAPGTAGPDGVSASELDLPALKTLVVAQEPSLEALQAIEDRFDAKSEFLAQKRGLEKPWYRNVSNALRRYRETRAAQRLDNREQALANDKQAVEVEVARFERYAERETRGPEMFKRLKFDSLKQTLAAPMPDVKLLRELAAGFAAPLAEVEGVNSSRGKPLAAALDHYCQLAGSPPDYTRLRVDFEQALDGLADDLTKYLASPTTEGAAAVDARLGWLVDNHQAYPARLALRPLETRPNFQIEIARPLAAIGVARRLDNEPIAINENILGTNVRGRGLTAGDVRLTFVPDTRQALFLTQLSATTSSSTVGVNGPATIYATGLTELRGEAIIEFDALGVRWRKPTVNATTSTRINGVATNSALGLVQRIASRKVAESKPQAEQASSRHAAARASARLDAELARTIGRANDDYLTRLRNPLLVRRAFPQPLAMQTTADWLSISAVEARPAELAATTAPPAVEAGSALKVRLHESAINNWAEAMLAGATITKAQIDALHLPTAAAESDENDDCPEAADGGDVKPRAAGEPKPERPIGDAAKNPPEPSRPWKIVFAEHRPVVVSIRDDRFTIELRLRAIESGENGAENKIIRAEYKVAQRCNGLRFTREISRSLHSRAHPTKAVARARSRAACKSSCFRSRRRATACRCPGPGNCAGKAPLRFVKLADGWASLGWDLPPNAAAMADLRH